MAAKKKTRIYDKRVDGCPYAPVDLESIWHEAFLAGFQKAVDMMRQSGPIKDSAVKAAYDKMIKGV